MNMFPNSGFGFLPLEPALFRNALLLPWNDLPFSILPMTRKKLNQPGRV